MYRFVAWLITFALLTVQYPSAIGPGVLNWPARIVWTVLMAGLSWVLIGLAETILVRSLRFGARTIRDGDRRIGSWLELRNPRAAHVWRWWHSLHGYQWASLIGVALGLTWFAFNRLDGYLDGSRPLTRSELDGDIAGIVGIYLLALWGTGMAYVDPAWIRVGSARLPVPRVSAAINGYAGLGAAVELLPDSIGFLTAPLRWPFKAGWRAIKTRFDRRQIAP